MAGKPDNVLLEHMWRFNRKLDDLIDDARELETRGTGVEEGLAGVTRRLDRLEAPVERIERRLGLTDVPR